jgi:hypothetical protein
LIRAHASTSFQRGGEGFDILVGHQFGHGDQQAVRERSLSG